MKTIRPKVLVVGSLNIDYIASVERLPAAGETVAATNLIQRFGGKGANQALAAARQGAAVTMIGCVGEDHHGHAYRKRLAREGIEVSAISTTKRALTGTALIAVDDAAENLIIVAPGANGELQPSAIRAAAPLIKAADIMLLQFEVPMQTVIAAVKSANRAAVPIVLNPSPFRKGFAWGQCAVDTLIANEHEAEAIFGLRANAARSQLDRWRRALAKKRIQRLVITRGPRPTICIDAESCIEVPALKVKPVDTVGAGDAFAGAFAARRAEGLDVESAVQYANCAGALATLKPGAQESIPSRPATEKAFRETRKPHRLPASQVVAILPT